MEVTKIKDVIASEIKVFWGDEVIEDNTATPVIKTNNLSYTGKISYDNLTLRSIDKDKIKDNYLKQGDLLIEKSGGTKTHSVGYVNYFDGDDNTYVANNFILVLRPNQDKIKSKYLFYQMRYFYEIGKFSDCYNKTTGIQNLKKDCYLNKKIKCSKFEAQDRVVKELESVENAINLKSKQLLALDELIKSRFIEMFGNYAADKTIGELTSICRGASPRPISNFITSGDGENWIKIGDVGENDIYITHTAEKVTKAGADKSRRVKPGDFILSNSMSFGRPYILGIDGCVHDGWLIISDYQNTFEPLFFYQLLRSDDVQSQFDGSANGACVRNLNSDLVKKVKVMTPPLELQKQFVDFFNQIDKSKFVCHSKYFL